MKMQVKTTFEFEPKYLIVKAESAFLAACEDQKFFEECIKKLEDE